MTAECDTPELYHNGHTLFKVDYFLLANALLIVERLNSGLYWIIVKGLEPVIQNVVHGPYSLPLR